MRRASTISLETLLPNGWRFCMSCCPRLFASASSPTRRMQWRPLLSRLEEGARSFGLQIGVLRVSSPAEIDTAFATAGREGHDALFVAPDTFFSSRRAQFAAVARRERIPACY